MTPMSRWREEHPAPMLSPTANPDTTKQNS